mmetsp:Transcript_2672/g.8956  ORF Transcript_2672/g.8956 Transcript_2672/m.8956 type:complete len:265 (+) Transcript_2672:87-881(+)
MLPLRAIAASLLAAPACLGLRLAQSPYGYQPAGFPQAAYSQPAYSQAAYPQAGYPQAAYQQAYYPQGAYGQPLYATQPAAAGAYVQDPNTMNQGLGQISTAQLPFEVKEAPGLVEGIKNLSAFIKRKSKSAFLRANTTVTGWQPILGLMDGGVKQALRQTNTTMTDLRLLTSLARPNSTLTPAERERRLGLQRAGKQVMRNIGTSALIGGAMGGDPHLMRTSPLEKAAYRAMAIGGVWVDGKNKPRMEGNWQHWAEDFNSTQTH